jgi:formate/nitrite transporter
MTSEKTNGAHEPAHAIVLQYAPALSLNQLGGTMGETVVQKGKRKVWELLLLAFLAGVYISIGGHVFMVALQQGMGKVVAGAVFSVGLVFVVVAGAELFTGNVIMVIGSLSNLVSCRAILRNWGAVYAGNLIGSYVFAFLIWWTGLMGTVESPSELGALASGIAQAKLQLSFGDAFTRAILCNMLVVLAIIMATVARDVISKVVCCVLPIMAFVASGFEHCVANMYLIPIGLLTDGASFTQHLGIVQNLIPVTLGNIVGGVLILVFHPGRVHQFLHYRLHRQDA